MKLAMMQSYFLPYIGYFQLINSADKFILYDKLGYIRHGWVNRNRILTREGNISYITVPVKHGNSNRHIFDTYINNTANWRRNILKAIYLNYIRAPFFEETYSLLEDIISETYHTISELNRASLSIICRHLEIPTLLIDDNDLYSTIEEEIKSMESTDRHHQRPISICKQEGAKIYINAIGGERLYFRDRFASEGIALFFIKTADIKYEQNQPEFYPNLSIADVLMYSGVKKTKDFLNLFELI